MSPSPDTHRGSRPTDRIAHWLKLGEVELTDLMDAPDTLALMLSEAEAEITVRVAR